MLIVLPVVIITSSPNSFRGSGTPILQGSIFSFLPVSIVPRVVRFIIWLNWSKEKRSILIGPLSGLNFVIRTAKMDL